MRRRLISLLLALLLLPLIAACGNTGGAGTTATGAAGGTGTQGEAATAAGGTGTQGETATGAAGGAGTQGETATAAGAETGATTAGAETTAAAGGTGEALKIGLVTDVGRLNDKSFNESSWNGTQMGAEAVGGEAKAIETADPNDYEQNIGQFVSENYNIIVTVGFALGEQTVTSAQANPNIKFIGVDQFQAETLPNLTGLIFDEDKAGFLAGALAASYSKAGKIGAVLATDTVPPVWKFGEGYRAGAKHVKPDIDVQIVYHSDVGLDKTFTDPEWGKATAQSMLDQGVDVIFGAGGGTGNGALIGIAERASSGAVGIGVDTDQYNTVPEAKSILLSSAMKILDQGVADLIQQAADGSFPGGNFVGQVGLAPFHEFEDKVSPEIKTQLEDIRKQLDDGTLKTNVAPAKPAS